LLASGGAARGEEIDPEKMFAPKHAGHWAWVALPVPFYTANTSAGLAGALVVFEDSPPIPGEPRRDDQIKVVAQVTVRRQVSLTTEGVKYWRDGFWRFTEESWLIRFPNYFWGVGNAAPDEARDTYTEQQVKGRLGLSARVWEEIYVGATMTAGAYRTADVMPGGAVSEYLTTHPASGALIGGGPFIRRDTRDDALAARHGSLTSLSAVFFRDWLGSSFVYTLWELDQRNYFTLGERTVLSLQGFARYAPGTPPLDELPALGGSNRLRGYYEGRFRDTLYWQAQAECRVRIWRRLALSPFAAVGNVFPGLSSISADRTKVAGGLGVRYGLTSDRDLNARFDVAVAPDSFAIYITLGEAF
jgi:hypothetical protein